MLLSTAGSVDWHSGSAPPPGSQPAMMTSPSQVKAAECHLPLVPACPTPGSVIVIGDAGSRGLLMSHTLIVSALAQAALLTSPRITPASWQPVRTSVAGPARGSRRNRLASSGSSSGTAMMSMKSPAGSSKLLSAGAPGGTMQFVLLEMLL